MIQLKQPALALHAHDVPGYKYQMLTTWQMPSGALAHDLVFWIKYCVDRSPELMLKNVVINCHGLQGRLFIGGGNNTPLLTGHMGILKKLRLTDFGTVWLIGCKVAMGGNGERFCSQMAVTIGSAVVAANDNQFVERRFTRGCPYGAIDDFEGTAYVFGPDGAKTLYSVHDPLAEEELYR